MVQKIGILCTYVMFGFSIFAGMRRNEIRNCLFEDITLEDSGDIKLVIGSRKNSKEPTVYHVAANKSERECCVVSNFQLYSSFVEPKVGPLFRAFRYNKFQAGPLGVGMIGKRPRAIADRLKLPNAAGFTGHSFRISSATILASLGFTALEIQRHLGHKHSGVSVGYVKDSEVSKEKVAHGFLGETPSLVQPKIAPVQCAKKVPVVDVHAKSGLENIEPESTASRFVFNNCVISTPVFGGNVVQHLSSSSAGVRRKRVVDADAEDCDFVPTKSVGRDKKRRRCVVVGVLSQKTN